MRSGAKREALKDQRSARGARSSGLMLLVGRRDAGGPPARRRRSMRWLFCSGAGGTPAARRRDAGAPWVGGHLPRAIPPATSCTLPPPGTPRHARRPFILQVTHAHQGSVRVARARRPSPSRGGRGRRSPPTTTPTSRQDGRHQEGRGQRPKRRHEGRRRGPRSTIQYDPFEDPSKTYRFIGIRYRDAIAPEFIINWFANGGRNVNVPMVGPEFITRHEPPRDRRLPDVRGLLDEPHLFQGKSDPTTSWDLVPSQLKLGYAMVDILYEIPLEKKSERSREDRALRAPHRRRRGHRRRLRQPLPRPGVPQRPQRQPAAPRLAVERVHSPTGDRPAAAAYCSPRNTPPLLAAARRQRLTAGSSEPNWANGGSQADRLPLDRAPADRPPVQAHQAVPDQGWTGASRRPASSSEPRRATGCDGSRGRSPRPRLATSLCARRAARQGRRRRGVVGARPDHRAHRRAQGARRGRARARGAGAGARGGGALRASRGWACRGCCASASSPAAGDRTWCASWSRGGASRISIVAGGDPGRGSSTPSPRRPISSRGSTARCSSTGISSPPTSSSATTGAPRWSIWASPPPGARAAPRPEGLTPRYAAPELFDGKPLTPRAEVYALGATLAEVLRAGGPAPRPGVARRPRRGRRARHRRGSGRALPERRRARQRAPPRRAPRRAAGGAARGGRGRRGTRALRVRRRSRRADRGAHALRAGGHRHHGAAAARAGARCCAASPGRSASSGPVAWIEAASVGDVAEALEIELGALDADPRGLAEAVVLVDDADRLGEAELGRLDGRAAAGSQAGARARHRTRTAADALDRGPTFEVFAMPALSAEQAGELVRRTIPSLPDAVVAHVVARAEGWPGRVRGHRGAPRPRAGGGAGRRRPPAGRGRRAGDRPRRPRAAARPRPLRRGGRAARALRGRSLARRSPSPARASSPTAATRRAPSPSSSACATADPRRRGASSLRASTWPGRAPTSARATTRRPSGAPARPWPGSASTTRPPAAPAPARMLAGAGDEPRASARSAARCRSRRILGEIVAVRGLAQSLGRAPRRGARHARSRRCASPARWASRASSRWRWRRWPSRSSATTASPRPRQPTRRRSPPPRRRATPAASATTRLNLAGIAQTQGDLAAAIRHLEAAVDMGRRSGRVAALRQALLNLANLELYLGRLARARVSLDALAAERADLPPQLEAQLLGARGRVRPAHLGDFAAAEPPLPRRRGGLPGDGPHRRRGRGAPRARALPGRAGAGADSPRSAAEIAPRRRPARRGRRAPGAPPLRPRPASRRSRGDDGCGAREAYDEALDGRARRPARRTGCGAPSRRGPQLEQSRPARRSRRAATARPRSPCSRRSPSASPAICARCSGTTRAARPSAPRRCAIWSARATAHGAPVGEDRLARVLEINRAIAGELDLARLLEKVTDHAIALLRAERGFVILKQRLRPRRAGHDERRAHRPPGARPDLSIHASRDQFGDDPHARFSQSIADKVMSTGEPVVTTSAPDDARMAGYVSVHQLMLQSVACVPIRARAGARDRRPLPGDAAPPRGELRRRAAHADRARRSGRHRHRDRAPRRRERAPRRRALRGQRRARGRPRQARGAARPPHRPAPGDAPRSRAPRAR